MQCRGFGHSNTSQCGKTRNSLPRKFFPSNQFIVKLSSLSSETLISQNFCLKTVAVKFRNFHPVSFQSSADFQGFVCQSDFT